MNILTKILVVCASAVLVSGAAYADEYECDWDWGEGWETETEMFYTESGRLKISGGKCETHRENNMEDTLRFQYDYGMRSGTWGTTLFESSYYETAGLFVASDSRMRNLAMDISHDHFYAFINDMNYYGDEYCENFDGINEDQLWIKRLNLMTNKRGDVATVGARASVPWTENTERQREREIIFRFDAKYEF